VAARWRYELCDAAGAKLSGLGRVLLSATSTFQLGRHASFTLRVPSDSDRISLPQTDGYPQLKARRRSLKVWQRYLASDGRFRYILRFAGPIYLVSDAGEESGVTELTAFDPMIMAA